MIRKYADLSRLEMEQVNKDETIVLIPLGAVEQHGGQAPLGTDMMIAQAMSDTLAREMEKVDPDFPMLLFPVIPLGLSMEHMGFCGSISLNPDTYYHVLMDISESLIRHGFRKLAFLVCHGGNTPVVSVVSRKLRSMYPKVWPFILSSGAFGHPAVKATVSPGNVHDFHGGEMETSMVMAIDPSLVHLEQSEAGTPVPFLNRRRLNLYGSVTMGWMGEDFLTETGEPAGIGGDPAGASAEKGKIILETSARELIPGLLDIRDWPAPKSGT